MTARYRVRQFIQAVSAWFQPVPGNAPHWPAKTIGLRARSAAESEQVQRYLSMKALDLFGAMPCYDRRHGVAVMRALQDQGYTEPALMVAALLHDAGKSAVVEGRLRLWHRVLFVLMDAVSPTLVGQIGQDQPGSWRRPFFAQQHHAAIGAELAQQAGCSRCTVELIRSHETPRGQTEDPLLMALQRADDLN